MFPWVFSVILFVKREGIFVNFKKATSAFAAAVIAVSAVTVTAFADRRGVEVSEENFPDEVFRGYVTENIDTDGDGWLNNGERLSVFKLNLSDQWVDYSEGNKIKSLKGIEYFTNLVVLVCDNNEITDMDLDENINLEVLKCSGNKLTSLNLSCNLRLWGLHFNNNEIADIDLSNNTELQFLQCSGNKLTSLDVRYNEKIMDIYCNNNMLGSIDLSRNSELRQLYCSGNSLRSLDLRRNRKLKYLSCTDNGITALDLRNNGKLKAFECDDNVWLI